METAMNVELLDPKVIVLIAVLIVVAAVLV
jgi:hypothetical protein